MLWANGHSEVNIMDKPNLTFQEKILIRHAHPISFTAHLIGLLWAGYFLWMGSFWIAILIFILTIGIGEGVGWLDRYYIFSPENINKFQKFLLTVYHPLNFISHIAAFIFIMYGLWRHSGALIIFGITLIPFGYLIPWVKTRKQRGLREVVTERDKYL